MNNISNFWIYPDWINDMSSRIEFVIQDDITDEIDSFGDLKDGWDYGKGVPPNSQIILIAKFVYLISKIQGFGCEPHPNSDGSITMILFIGDHFLDVDITNDEKLILNYEIGKGKEYNVIWKDQLILLSQLEYVLFEIKYKCNQNTSSETLTSSRIIVNKSKDSKIEEFSANIKEGSQFSQKSAQSKIANMGFVPI